MRKQKYVLIFLRKIVDIIDGIIVVLPNFGEELGVAEAIQLSGLDVPILIQLVMMIGTRWI